MVINTRKPIFGVHSGFGFLFGSLLHLLQNATYIITKCDSCFIAKYDESWLKNPNSSQNATDSSQNATDSSQNVTDLSQNATDSSQNE